IKNIQLAESQNSINILQFLIKETRNELYRRTDPGHLNNQCVYNFTIQFQSASCMSTIHCLVYNICFLLSYIGNWYIFQIANSCNVV
ncbi:hypothetical protein L9F63_008620, partial [Diploptera punctata]